MFKFSELLQESPKSRHFLRLCGIFGAISCYIQELNKKYHVFKNEYTSPRRRVDRAVVIVEPIKGWEKVTLLFTGIETGNANFIGYCSLAIR